MCSSEGFLSSCQQGGVPLPEFSMGYISPNRARQFFRALIAATAYPMPGHFRRLPVVHGSRLYARELQSWFPVDPVTWPRLMTFVAASRRAKALSAAQRTT